MFVAQLAAALAVWGVLGWALWRRSEALRQFVVNVATTRRAVLGVVLLFASAAVLFGTFAALQSLGALGPNGLTSAGWLVATAGGAVFIGLQVLAAAFMVSLALEHETPNIPEASIPSEQELP